MSSNSTVIVTAAHTDASRYTGVMGRLDIKNISEADARKLMSAEHKALGYRPPPGSLAASAQAAAAKHELKEESSVSEEEIMQAAIEDAIRIQTQRSKEGLDINAVGEAEARKLMSEEHKALGHRPPPGSLAAEAQRAAAKHPEGFVHPPTTELERAALQDAINIASTASEAAKGIDLNYIGEAEARRIMSEEHKALGYRPPPGSLAAEAQSAAAKHPNASAGVDPAILAKAALEDAKKIESQRRSSSASPPKHPSPAMTPEFVSRKPETEVNLHTITAPESHKLQSEEQKILGYRPPKDSVAAQAQSAVDKRAQEPVTKEMAAEIQSEEHKAKGHLPESGSIAAVAQHLADKNENDGGERTLGDVGL